MMLSHSHWDEAHTKSQSPHHSSLVQDGQAPETEMTDASKSQCQLTELCWGVFRTSSQIRQTNQGTNFVAAAKPLLTLGLARWSLRFCRGPLPASSTANLHNCTTPAELGCRCVC